MAKIRWATAADIDAVSAIEGDADQRYAESAHPELALGGTIPLDVLTRAVASERLLVATEDDVVQGWVLLIRSEGELCVGQISVRRQAGQRGIGTQLLTHVIDAARANGEHSILLNTQSDVPWNRPWYERHGFVALDPVAWTDDMRVMVKEQTDAGLDWNTRVHMRLVLDT